VRFLRRFASAMPVRAAQAVGHSMGETSGEYRERLIY
jgi:hypothetical protein